MLGPAIEEQAAYANAQITFHAAFMQYLVMEGKDEIEDLAMEVPSNTATEEHIFLGDIPGFKEWVGDREMQSLAAHNIIVKNRDFASGVSIHRNQIMDDKLGLVMPSVAGLATRAKQHKPTFLAEAWVNGFAGTANFGSAGDANLGPGLSYDGAFFFSAAHSLDGGPNQSNTGTAKLGYQSLEAAITAMRRLKTYDGKVPLYVNPTHILVGPALEFTAKRLLEQEITVLVPNATAGSTFETGGQTNIHKGRLKLLVSPRLDDYTAAGGGNYANYWGLVDLKHPVKPFLFQSREPIRAVSQVDWNNPDMFKRGQMNFGANARYNVGNYDWRLAYGSTGAV